MSGEFGEPWVQGEYGGIKDRNRNFVVRRVATGQRTGDMADDARIIACVNVLAGIPTEQVAQQVERWREIERVALEFCAKVDRGEARSVRTYGAFKAAFTATPESGEGS